MHQDKHQFTEQGKSGNEEPRGACALRAEHFAALYNVDLNPRAHEMNPTHEIRRNTTPRGSPAKANRVRSVKRGVCNTRPWKRTWSLLVSKGAEKRGPRAAPRGSAGAQRHCKRRILMDFLLFFFKVF